MNPHVSFESLSSSSIVPAVVVKRRCLIMLLSLLLFSALGRTQTNWTKDVEQAAWAARNDPGLFVYNEHLYLYGGWKFDDQYNIVYYKDYWMSDNGTSWTQIAQTPEWVAVEDKIDFIGATAGVKVIEFKGKLWAYTLSADNTIRGIWQSTDALTWSKVADDIPWLTGRELVAFKGQLWLFEDFNWTTQTARVWFSNDGLQWTLSSAALPFSPIAKYYVSIFHDALWVSSGGYYEDPNTFTFNRDTWRSNDGENWEQVSLENMNITLGQVLVINDTFWNTGMNNVSFFSNDGIHWQKLKNRPLPYSLAYQSMIVFKNKAWMLGGMVDTDTDDYSINSIWSSPLLLITQDIFVDDDNTTGPWDGTSAHPYNNIDDALNSSGDISKIIVNPGTYNSVRLHAGVNLVSTNPLSDEVVRSTIINGSVLFYGDEMPSNILSGFTITNGSGVDGNNSNATIEHNRIIHNTNNEVIRHYEVVYNGPYPEMVLVSIEYNGFGGGIRDHNGPIQNNIIANNYLGDPTIGAALATVSVSYNYYGAALYNCNGTICNNTITGNYATLNDSGVIYNCHGTIVNNIVWDNPSLTPFINSSTPTYNCFPNNVTTDTTNLHVDPQLADPANGDYHLLPVSPCIDAGAAVSLTSDIDGDKRPTLIRPTPGGDGSGFDIGADEYVANHEEPIMVVVDDETTTPTVGNALKLDWYSLVGITGSGVKFQLHGAGGKTYDLGVDWNPNGFGQATFTMPTVPTGEYRVMMSSTYAEAYSTLSDPFTVQGTNNAIPAQAWAAYE